MSAPAEPTLSCDLNAAREISAPLFVHPNGELTVLQTGDAVPFAIERVFCITAPEGAVRGRHAHRRCSQLLFAVSGAVRVNYNDGSEHRSVLLSRMNSGFLVPPGIWAEEVYVEPGSLLMVLCDQPYDESDYIRSYDAYLAEVGASKQEALSE